MPVKITTESGYASIIPHCPGPLWLTCQSSELMAEIDRLREEMGGLRLKLTVLQEDPLCSCHYCRSNDGSGLIGG